MDRSIVQKLRKRNAELRDTLHIANVALKAARQENKRLHQELRIAHNAFQNQFNKINQE